MKLSFRLFIALLGIYSFPTENSFGARNSSNKKRTNNKIMTSSNSSDKTKQDCITKYIAAIDKECYNSNNTNKGGVYHDCSDKTIVELYDIMDMQLANIVGNDKLAQHIKTCSSYKGEAVSKWLGAKTVIEESAVKSSDECIYATDKLSSAKKCYAAALAHDGNFFDFANLMKANCGEFPEVAQKFTKAGDLGLSNIPQMLENYTSLQFTDKADNWRTAIEATLVGYIYEAKDACGEENYDIIEFNTFEKDTRENLLTIAKKSFASQMGEQLGSRTENLLSTGKPTVGKPTASINKDTLIGKSTAVFYKNMGWDDRVFTDKKSNSNRNDFGNTTPQLPGNSKLNEIFVIDGVTSLNNAKARLANIIKTGDIGTSYNQDTLDIAIANAMGARGVNDSSFYNILSDLEDGDTFVIKHRGGSCMVLTLKNDNLIKLSYGDIEKISSLETYMNGCNDLVE